MVTVFVSCTGVPSFLTSLPLVNLEHLKALYYLLNETDQYCRLFLCHPRVHVLLGSWGISAFSGFLSFIDSMEIIYVDINAHLDVVCTKKSRFKDILKSCSLIQSIKDPSHTLRHHS